MKYVVLSEMKKANQLTILLFVVALIEIFAEYFRIMPVIYVFKPLISIILMWLYWEVSSRKELLFFLTIGTSLLTNILFIPANLDYIFYGLVVFIFHRIINIYYIIKVTNSRDILSVLLGSTPFLFIFFYIFFETDLLNTELYFIMIVHNVLVSVLGGYALVNHIFNESNRSLWLTISVLLFVSLHFIIFIEKFYLSLKIYRPIAMTLNTLAYYSFYKFIIKNEENIKAKPIN